MSSGYEAQQRGSGAARAAPTVADLAVRAIGMAVIATDTDGVIELWNPGAEQLYGWSAAEAIGQPVTRLLTLPFDEQEAEAILARSAGGRSWSGDFPVVDRSGRAFAARSLPVARP